MYLKAAAYINLNRRKHMHIELNRCDFVILQHLQMLEIYRLMFRQVCRIEKVMNVIRISIEFVPFDDGCVYVSV